MSLDDTALPGLEGDGAKAMQHACMSRDLISVDIATGRPSSQARAGRDRAAAQQSADVLGKSS